MPLPTSGPITSQMIRQQYGGSLPFRIRDYYRGGALVPNNSANTGVPTSGTISLRSFLGQGGTVTAPLAASNSGASQTDTVPSPAPASKSVTATGNVFASGGSGSYTCTWSHLSGSTSIPTPGTNVFNPSFTATVIRESTLSAVKRCTVSDGSSSVNTDMNVSLTYQSGI